MQKNHGSKNENYNYEPSRGEQNVLHDLRSGEDSQIDTKSTNYTGKVSWTSSKSKTFATQKSLLRKSSCDRGLVSRMKNSYSSIGQNPQLRGRSRFEQTLHKRK